MSAHDVTAARNAAAGRPAGATRAWTVPGARAYHAARPAGPALPNDTRYHIWWRGRDGAIEEMARPGPSARIFTDSFAALARGCLVQTPDGPAAVEDLLPGDRIVTEDGPEQLLWKGSRVIAPQHHSLSLYRIAADALGPGRPMPDLLLGPAARLVSRRGALPALIGASRALVPIEALADGESVVQVRPVSGVPVFHLGFARHTIFTANGVELDSVHPGAPDPSDPAELWAQFLGMFPHLGDRADFGPLAAARLSGEVLDRVAQPG